MIFVFYLQNKQFFPNSILIIKRNGDNNEKVLFVLNEKNINVIKSFRNINNVKYLLADYLNTKDLLEYKKILFLESALNKINTK